MLAYFCPKTYEVVLCKVGKGISTGAISVCVPFYLFEILKPQHRGMGIGALGLGAISGQAIILTLGFVLQQYFAPTDAFHFTWLGEAGLGALALLLSLFVPDLPSTLSRRGRQEGASKTVDKLLTYYDWNDFVHEPAFPFRSSEMFTSRMIGVIFKVLAAQVFGLIACLCLTSQFSAYVFALCGLNDTEATVAVICQYSLMLVFAIVPVHLLKRARRKDYLVIGFFLLTAFFAAMGALVTCYGTPAAPTIIFGPEFALRGSPAAIFLAILGVLVVITTVFIYATTLLYTLEALPCAARVKGLSIALFGAWSVNAALEGSAHMVRAIIPSFLFFGLAIVCSVATIFYLFVKDTRGLSFGEGIPFEEQLPNKVPPVSVPFVPASSGDSKPPVKAHRVSSLKGVSRKVSSSRLSLSDPHRRQVSIESPASESVTPLYTANTQFGEPHARERSMGRSFRRVDSKPSTMWLESLNIEL